MTTSKDEIISEETKEKWKKQKDEFDKARLDYIARLPFEQRKAFERYKKELEQTPEFSNNQAPSNNEDQEKTVLMKKPEEASSSNYLESSLKKARRFIDKIR